MSENITINLTEQKEEITFLYTDQQEEIVFSFSEAARGATGEPGASVTVDQTIIDGSTNAVSGNAVFDGLALKAPINNPTFTGIVIAPRITGRCDGLEVFCKAGLAINAGQVVYVTGASGNNIIIGLAQSNAESTSSKTIGISESTLANNATGYVITEGLMPVSISAPTANEGDPIWLSSTTAGGMVFGLANKPSAPNHIVYLGVVTRKTGNTIVEIYVKIQNGAELDELADVAITSPVPGQALMRGASLWENRSLVSSDISDAKSSGTGSSDAGKLVEFGSQGEVAFAGVDTANAITGSSNSGRGALLTSNSGIGATITSTSGTGAVINGGSGLNHVQFGGTVGDNRSFVRRVLGLFGWHRGSFVQTLGSPATLTADSAITLPDTASGTVALTSDARFTDERVPTSAGLTSKFGTNKASVVNGDKITILDSAASDAPKHILWSLIVSTLTTAFNALYVGLTGDQTVAGNKTLSGVTSFTSTTRPTSSGTGTPDSTSLMTRADSDTRYGGPVYFASLSSNTSYTNDATGTVILSIALPPGTYFLEAFVRFTANAANSKIIPSILEGLSPTFSGYRGQYNNGSSPSRIAGVNVTSVSGGPWGTTSNTDNHERGGVFVASTSTNTYQLTAAQNTSSATTTTVSAGSYLMARKIS